MTEQEVPYAAGAPSDLSNVDIRPTRRGEQWVLSGKCPRCHHDIWKGLGPLRGIGFGESHHEARRRVRVTCNCTTPHPGGSEGKNGCGADFYVEIGP